MEDAGLATGAGIDDMGVYLGTALRRRRVRGRAAYRLLLRGGLRGVSLTLALAVYGGAGAAQTAIELGLHGPQHHERQLVRAT
ncbi:MAG: hypothetical protein U0531_21440 [Dehalococcoidia bacterium]